MTTEIAIEIIEDDNVIQQMKDAGLEQYTEAVETLVKAVKGE